MLYKNASDDKKQKTGENFIKKIKQRWCSERPADLGGGSRYSDLVSHVKRGPSRGSLW